MAVTEGMNNARRTVTLFLKHHGHPGICLSRRDLTFGGENTGGEPRVDRRRWRRSGKTELGQKGSVGYSISGHKTELPFWESERRD